MEEARSPLLHLRGVTKTFGSNRAVDAVDIEIACGRVHALLGQNGAGKSTLISIMAGVHRPDEGTMEFQGRLVDVQSPSDALSLGIVAVYQELSLVPELTVAENLFLGLEPSCGPWLRRRVMRTRAVETLELLGASAISVNTKVRDLPVAHQQLVEIGKAMIREAKVLILDEPSAVLGRRELQLLYNLVHRLRARGIAIIYITHRLDEVMHLADDVTVMRDGRCIMSQPIGDLGRDDLIEALVGQRLDAFESNAADRTGEVILEVKNLLLPGLPNDGMSFEVRSREIVGVAGLMGSGRSRLLRALAGLEPVLAGQVTLDGNVVRLGRLRFAMARGIVLVPEDRKRFGLVLERSTSDNLTLSVLSRESTAGVLRRSRLRVLTGDLIARLGVKAANPTHAVKFLSGGNQQKVVLGRCLATNPRVLLLDEPLRGVDVGAKADILNIIRSFAASGAAVLVVSSELEDLLALTDRVMIMRDGDLVQEFVGGELNEEAALAVAVGGTL